MIDERLDVMHRPLFARRRRQRMVRLVVALGHVLQTLIDNPEALAHLFDTDPCPIVTVAPLRRGNIEIELLISGVGPLFPEIPIKTASSESRPGNAPVDRLLQGVGADPLGAGLENAVFHDDLFVLVEARRQVVEEFPH